MRLPMRAFWLMLQSIARIEAERDLRALKVGICSQSGEAAEGLIEELNARMDQASTVRDSPLNARRDQEGFDELRRMSALGL
jgi:hypothetical protein